MCHYGKDPAPDEPVTGISDTLLKIMQSHAENIPSLKWQYFGNEHGTLYTYPAVDACSVANTYDPRFRLCIVKSRVFYIAPFGVAKYCN